MVEWGCILFVIVKILVELAVRLGVVVSIWENYIGCNGGFKPANNIVAGCFAYDNYFEEIELI